MITIDDVVNQIKSIMSEYIASCDKIAKIKQYISNIENEVGQDNGHDSQTS